MKDATTSSVIANLDFIISILNRCFASADVEDSIYCKYVYHHISVKKKNQSSDISHNVQFTSRVLSYPMHKVFLLNSNNTLGF